MPIYSDPEKKKRLQEDLKARRGTLKTVISQKEKTENMAIKKLLRKGKKVIKQSEGAVEAATARVSCLFSQGD